LPQAHGDKCGNAAPIDEKRFGEIGGDQRIEGNEYATRTTGLRLNLTDILSEKRELKSNRTRKLRKKDHATHYLAGLCHKRSKKMGLFA
jgi:hypothetical protein